MKKTQSMDEGYRLSMRISSASAVGYVYLVNDMKLMQGDNNRLLILWVP